ncbi:AQG_2a_G0016860.mRNA.1.CDS.1 [Saccharomyces cerevisiae]|nr:Y55_G0049440.mRNA.1.CDS.1 [Saccharomyces cerevisiae]CAI4235569.1 CQI_4a_G0000130.mRNA.1.CDS.1 [Saccharomyces cerevisiae]CAI4239731.1 AGK_G0000830.mRNA.1.CDS.1 [Saccharomyces cerevisiae]CAI4239754.1 CPG_1a_G0000810.mRNA.1.CDS.1 [Saccharomyces cerevisiae]CAI4240467.1 BFP_1a_G0000800.mRNA.1.CDS.1 [Saccharomyces cerevisiae]
MYEYLLLTRKNGLFCLAINEPSPIFALTIIAIFSSTNVRSSVLFKVCACSFIFISNSFALVFKISAEA